MVGRNKPCYFKSSRYHLTIKRNSFNVICFLLSNSNPNQTANKWLLYIIIIITWSKEPDHDELPEADQQTKLDFSRLLDLMFCAWQRDVIRPFGLSHYDIQDPLIIRKIYQNYLEVNLHCLTFKLNLWGGGAFFKTLTR